MNILNDVSKTNPISFMERLELSSFVHGYRTMKTAFEDFVEAFNNEMQNIISDKEKRHLIKEYADFAFRLYKTQNLLHINTDINDIEDPEMKALCIYINTLMKKSMLERSPHEKLTNLQKAGALRIRRNLTQQAEALNCKIQQIDSFEDFYENEEFMEINKSYARILSGLILQNTKLGYITDNSHSISNDETIQLSKEIPRKIISQKFLDYETFLLEKKILFKYNCDQEFIVKLKENIENKEKAKAIKIDIEKQKETAYKLFDFGKRNLVYDF